jgi:hypothetical protein
MDKAGAEVAIESAQDARVGLAEFQTKHAKILNRFGLSIAHEAGEGLRHGLPSGPISIRVTDVNAFLRYAQSVKPVMASGSNSENPFGTLLQTIEKQVRGTDFEHPSPDGQSLLENLDMVAAAFKRIGPDLETRNLDAYARYQKEGRLQQYLTVEREGLWHNAGGGFGPADWVGDITPRLLDEKWKKAVGMLRSQQELGKVGVAKELKDHLLSCIEKATERLTKMNWTKDYNFRDDFEKIMSKHAAEIETIETE